MQHFLQRRCGESRTTPTLLRGKDEIASTTCTPKSLKTEDMNFPNMGAKAPRLQDG